LVEPVDDLFGAIMVGRSCGQPPNGGSAQHDAVLRVHRNLVWKDSGVVEQIPPVLRSIAAGR